LAAGSFGGLGRSAPSGGVQDGTPIEAARSANAGSALSVGSCSTESQIMAREKIILGCTECKNRNYFTMKNKRLHPERVEWKKYCPRCNAHKTHKETK
jgi:large subunit ribosomal protein L33